MVVVDDEVEEADRGQGLDDDEEEDEDGDGEGERVDNPGGGPDMGGIENEGDMIARRSRCTSD